MFDLFNNKLLNFVLADKYNYVNVKKYNTK